MAWVFPEIIKVITALGGVVAFVSILRALGSKA